VRVRRFLLPCLAAVLSSCGGGGNPNGNCNGCVDGPHNLGIAAVADHAGSSDVAAVGSNIATGVQYVNVFLRGANGQYAAPVTYSITPKDDSIVAADLNGDGLPDLIGFNSLDGTGHIPILLNDPAHPGTFGTVQTLTANGTVGVLAVGDLNGDGLNDIAVAAGGEIEVFMQNSQSPGTFAGPAVLSSASTGAVAIGDLNGDKVADIAMSTATGITVLFQSSTTPGSYQAVSLGTTATAGTTFIGIADVDGDGLNDLIVSGPTDASGVTASLLVLLQDKQNPGHFLAPASYPTLGDAFNLVVLDLGGTGTKPPDLIVGASDGVSVLLHDPQHPGAFLAAANYTQTDGTGVAVTDVNGDGLPDLIVAGPNPPAVGVLPQDAAHPGTFLTLGSL
jgi:hypothetical protein